MTGLLETEEDRIKAHVKRWLEGIDAVIRDEVSYMREITRESKYMVDEFDSRVADTSIELAATSREPVVYEFLVAATGIAGTILIGRRRFPVPIGITALPLKMRVFENDRRILMTGTPEVPGVVPTALFFEMTGHMYPHVSK